MRLLLLALLAATAYANNSYVVMAPSHIRANMDFSISVNILKASNDVTVTATIVGSGSSPIAHGSGVFRAASPGTIDLQIPKDLISDTYHLQVRGQGGLSFTDSVKLEFSAKEISVFIQTDKAIYKPGDIINFRTLAFYSDMSPFSGPMDIAVYDGNGNQIEQWLQVNPDNGVITRQLPLSSQPVIGDWKLSVSAKGSKGEKVFTVAEYVLPRFEVSVALPPYIVRTEDSTIDFTVNAKYTYGKPVKGSLEVFVKVLEPLGTIRINNAPEVAFKGKIDGTIKLSVSLPRALAVHSSVEGLRLLVSANVTESVSNNSMNGNNTVNIYDERVVMEFPEANPTTFKPGLRYTAYLKLSQPDGLPLPPINEKVRIIPTYKTSASSDAATLSLPEFQNSVPDNGLILISISIPGNAHSVDISAQFMGITRKLSITRSYSPSNSYLQLSGLQNGDTILFQAHSTQPMGNLLYQILSRGEVVKTGTAGGKGQTSHLFTIKPNTEMTPSARCVVYYVRDDGEIVTDSISFDVDGIFKNKVTVSLNQTEAEPNDKVEVTVKADPSSVAHLLAIDQSVLLLKSGNDISKREVFDEIQRYDTSNKPTHDIWPSDAFAWPYPIYYDGKDASHTFRNAGVTVITDALLYDHDLANTIVGTGTSNGIRLSPSSVKGTDVVVPATIDTINQQPLVEPTRVRFHFPESWLWSQLDVGSSGSASVITTVPDTITSWVISAFAVNPVSGFGLAPTTKLTTFQPFFVTLNLPYSVVRGEQLAVQAIVFNYLDEGVMVRVTLERSDEFFAIDLVDGKEHFQQKDVVKTIWVEKNSAVSVYFPILPLELGKIDIEVKAQSSRAADAIRRQLLVKAEGVPKEFNTPIFIDLANGQREFSKTVELQLPNSTVEGSELVRVTAIGDILGPSIAGLEQLIHQPSGCGEQNMIRMAPDVYIADYLSAINQLSAPIRKKVYSYMADGYQTELNYKRKDGSFSAFGERDSAGSMWLTAYVTRVFEQASSHIFIDKKVLQNAMKWMMQRQNNDGSFPEPGRVIHKDLQSQSGSGTGLTAFVLISILENEGLFDKHSVDGRRLELAKDRALSYLEAEVLKSDDLYILALTGYAFQLAKSAKAGEIINKLEGKAIIKDGRKFWQTSTTGSSTALDIEITAYVLLTYAARRDLTSGHMTMQWIVEQRNPNGGFYSTQDTVVALAALSEYTRLSPNDLDMTVTAHLDQSSSYNFNIDNSNSLILQTRETRTVPSQVTVSAKGKGTALLEVGVFLNVLQEIERVTFGLVVTIIKEDLSYLEIEVCTKWTGDEPASGMAVMEIGILSGFDVDRDSISELDILKRIDYETKDQTVVLYFDEIGKSEVCLRFKARRTGLVAKSQPAPVRIFDYYAPQNQKTVFYKSDLLSGLGIHGLL